jgi:hypothetical protein
MVDVDDVHAFMIDLIVTKYDLLWDHTVCYFYSTA